MKELKDLLERGVFLVIRGKENIKLELTQRPLSPTDEANPHIQCDTEGYLSSPKQNTHGTFQIWYLLFD